MVGYTLENHVLRLRLRIAVKLISDGIPDEYTSPNENFEYSYPLDIYILSVAALHKTVGKMFKILGYAKDLCK